MVNEYCASLEAQIKQKVEQHRVMPYFSHYIGCTPGPIIITPQSFEFDYLAIGYLREGIIVTQVPRPTNQRPKRGQES